MRKTLLYILLLSLPFVSFAQGKHSRWALNPEDKMSVLLENNLIDAVNLIGEARIGEAVKILQELERIFPKYDAVQYYLGNCALIEGDAVKAEKHFAKAAVLDSMNTYYADALISALIRNRKQQQVTELYGKLIERFPTKYKSPSVLTILGDAALSSYRDSLALARYNEALQYDPQYTPALLGKAEVCRMTGNYPQFFVTIDRFVKDPDVLPQPKCEYVRQVINRADAKMAGSWFAQLDSMVAGCLNTHPADTSALKLAGWWYFGTGRKDEGKAYFQQWLDSYPEDLSAHVTMLELLLSEGKTDEAMDESDRIIELARRQDSTNELVTAYLVKGDTYYQRGDTRQAFANYDLALKLDPDNLPVLNNYAYYLSLLKKNLRKAAAMSRKTVEAEPDNATYLDTYGWILYLQKKPAEAKPYFKHAMLYGGKEDSVVLEHYSIVLKALGEDSLSEYYKGLSEKKSK